MTAIDKTNSLLRLTLPVSLIDADPLNPNRMSAREFDLLVANMQEIGFTDPALVRPADMKAFGALAKKASPDIAAAVSEAGLRVVTVGGHHRIEAAKYLGFESVPVTVITDPAFTEELAHFQLVRHNVIKGKMDAQAFVTLYAQYAGKYDDDLLQEMFGFANEADFKALITATAKQLPKEMQSKFKEAAKEIKTIDGLAKLLNEMFTKHGDTLPQGYMVLDYGGHDSVWVHIDKPTLKAVYTLGDMCRQHSVTMDDLLGGVVRAIAKGEAAELTDKILKKAPKTAVPDALQTLPTHDNIATHEAI